MKLTSFISIFLLLITSCNNTIARPVELTEKLNISNINLLTIYPFSKSLSGAFCTKNEFQELASDRSNPPIGLYILKSNYNSPTQYFNNIRGYIRIYNQTTTPTFEKSKINNFPSYIDKCGPHKDYPYIYSYTISLEPLDKPTTEYKKDYNLIIEQINNRKFLEVVAVRPPYMSFISPLLVSKSPERIYFSDEQIEQITNW